MADAGWPSSGDLTPAMSPHLAALFRRVAQAPHAFDLFHLLRQVDALCPKAPRLGESVRPADDILRIGQPPEMGFAPAALSELAPGDASQPVRLQTWLFVMFGSNGALPLHLTEYAHARALHHGDTTLARFVDLFHHRLATLFFRACGARNRRCAR